MWVVRTGKQLTKEFKKRKEGRRGGRYESK
jgi:hypothetical protein